MVTKIKLTIGDKTYRPGEKITQKLSKADEAFLRREGYIEDEKSQEKAPARSKG
ncbi:MAG: hypothetical protein K1W06_11340 [Lachnospiraceae bacterium]